MTKAERIKKLANAIREFRGVFNPETKEWRRHPKPSAQPRVVTWLKRLQLDVEASLLAINGFQTFEEFEEWIRKLAEPKQT